MSIAESYSISQGWVDAQAHALPQFLSPYHWKLVVTNKDQYHVAYVNLVKKASQTASTKNNGSFIAQVRAYFKPASELNWLVHDRYGQQTDTQA